MHYQVKCLIHGLELKGEVCVEDKTDVLRHEKLFLGDKLLYLLFYSMYFSAFLMFSAMKKFFF